ncbi:MAG: hypothetical protein R3286_19025, partial [Gammaproteobacteria bacterium]|nr:hypothetical protein [Gammaproteobacteria bacterium]
MADDETAAGQGGDGESTAKSAAAKKTTKKTARKTTRKTAKKTAKKSAAAPSAPPREAQTHTPLPPPSTESEGGMRGIVALWGPLTIIFFLFQVSPRGGDAGVSPERAAGGAAPATASGARTP